MFGMGGAQALRLYVPALPVDTPPEYILATIGVSLLVGIASGLLPARRAASLDPVAALAEE